MLSTALLRRTRQRENGADRRRSRRTIALPARAAESVRMPHREFHAVRCCADCHATHGATRHAVVRRTRQRCVGAIVVVHKSVLETNGRRRAGRRHCLEKKKKKKKKSKRTLPFACSSRAADLAECVDGPLFERALAKVHNVDVLVAAHAQRSEIQSFTAVCARATDNNQEKLISCTRCQMQQSAMRQTTTTTTIASRGPSRRRRRRACRPSAAPPPT
jgi:hypothetical protein